MTGVQTCALPIFSPAIFSTFFAAATIYHPNPFFNISCSSNYSSEIYRKWIWLIYFAQVITWARYIEKWIWLIYHGCSEKCWKYGRQNCINNYDKNAYLLIVWNLFLYHRILVLHLLLWDLAPLCVHRSLLVRLTKPSTFFFVKELINLDASLALFQELP